MNVSIKIIYGVVGHTKRNIYVEFNRGSSVAFVYGFKEVDKRLQVYYLIFKTELRKKCNILCTLE